MPSPFGQSLGSYLDSLKTVAKTMSFAAIESVLMKSLPQVALVDKNWWFNPRNPATTSWDAFCDGAGWECVHIETKHKFAIFRTLADVPAPPVPSSIDKAAENFLLYFDASEKALIGRTDIGR